jgi:hypothetical protein
MLAEVGCRSFLNKTIRWQTSTAQRIPNVKKNCWCYKNTGTIVWDTFCKMPSKKL